MVAQSKIAEGHEESRSPQWVETASTDPRRPRPKSSVTVQDPMKAIAYFLMIFAGLGILVAYIALEHPGISAANWRSSMSPYHPANPPSHLVMTGPQGMAMKTVEKIKVALDTTVEGQAHAAGE